MPEATDRWTQQIRKGSTRLAVLQLVSERERYGYEIIAAIRDRTDGALELAEGNVYPALHALEAEGHVASRWREVEPGVPPRKYYRVTGTGRDHLSALVAEWRDFAGAVARLLEGEPPHADDAGGAGVARRHGAPHPRRSPAGVARERGRR